MQGYNYIFFMKIVNIKRVILTKKLISNNISVCRFLAATVPLIGVLASHLARIYLTLVQVKPLCSLWHHSAEDMHG